MTSCWASFSHACHTSFRNRSSVSFPDRFRKKCSNCGQLKSDNLYARMLKEEAQMNWKYNLCAGIANWILLAGYLVVPGTFASLEDSTEVQRTLQNNSAGRVVLHTIRNPPLLIVACIFLLFGGLVLGWLSVIFRDNYTWLINRVFTPVCLNAAAGLLTTLVSVFGSHKGQCSLMALVTFVVTGTTLCFFLALIAIFRLWKLRKVIDEDKLQHLFTNPSLVLSAKYSWQAT